MPPLVVIIATGAKSFSTSYIRLAVSAVLIVNEVDVISSVCPSGAARATVCAPTPPVAPGLLSITIGCPRRLASWSPTMRLMVSDALPGG